jgi:hypothetical protein
MQRRNFLKTAAAGAALSATGPYFLGAADKAGSKTPVVGTGEHKYECVHNWGELPADFKWETTHGVCVDAAGLVYVTHMGFAAKDKQPRDVVVVFDPQGKFVRSFGKEFYGGGHGIDVRKDGDEEFLYLCNMQPVRSVAKTTLKGEVVWKKSFPQEAHVYKDVNGFAPTNVAFKPDGGFYVGDGYGSNYIHEYDKDAKYVRTFGGTGVDYGKLVTPHGLWLDDRNKAKPELIVADRANARLQYFSLDGKHLRFIHDVLFPAHFDIRGDLLLCPDLHARVTLFDKDNSPVAHLGDDLAWRKKVLAGFKVRADEKQWQPGKFIHPHDACFDKDGNIFVVEWVQTGRVTLLKKLA